MYEKLLNYDNQNTMENKLQQLTQKLYDEGLEKGRAEADKLVADAHVAAQREHDKLLAQSQKEIQELAMTATEKLLLTKQGGDPYDQFLDKAEEEQHG